MSTTLPVWINGDAAGSISPADRGLAYGDGLFETLRIANKRVVLEAEHFMRLEKSAHALGISVDLAELKATFARFLTHCPADGVVKIILTRGAGGRGYLPDAAMAPTCILSAHPLPVVSSLPLSVVTASLQLAQQPLLAGHKHLNRLEQVLLRRELAQHGADEAVVCDTHHQVIEGVSNNLFFVKENRLCTPRVNKAGVAGVLRGHLLRYAAEKGIAVEEACYTIEELLQADEIFFCNSVMGIRLVQQWQHASAAQPITTWLPKTGAAHTITTALLEHWQALLSQK